MTRFSMSVAVAILAVACSAEPSSDGVKLANSEIRNGTTVSAEQSGHVVGPFGSATCCCSYELLTNTWLITARHCLGPQQIGFTVTMGSQARTIAAVRLHPKWDAALVSVTAPFTMNGSTTGYRREIYAGPNVSLKGRTATCFGYGQSSPNVSGTLRMAELPIVDVHANPDVDPLENASVDYGVNSSGQYHCAGDSGGSCFVDGHIAGLANSMSSACNSPTNSSGVGAESFREWVYANIGMEFPVGASTPADILLSGAPSWESIPVAASLGTGSFSVTNGSVYAFGGWSGTAGVERLRGDFNGDGRYDLALAGPSGWNFLPVALSHNNGGFRIYEGHPGSFPTWASTTGARRLVADVNTDFREDIALVGNTGVTKFRFAVSNGDGNFTPTERSEASTSVLSAQTFNQLATPATVAALAGDFDGNGSGDIALVGGSNWLTIPTALTSGSGSSLAVKTRNREVRGFATAARDSSTKKLVGDFDGNGSSDILLLGPANSDVFRLALSTSDGFFDDTFCKTAVGPLSAQQFNSLALLSGVEALVGDYNGDGRADVALTGGSGWMSIPVAMFTGCDVATFNRTVGTTVFPWGAWAATTGVTKLVGRFTSDNSDQRSDIALTGGSNWRSIPVASSNGDGSFTVTNADVGDFGAWSATNGVQRIAGDVR